MKIIVVYAATSPQGSSAKIVAELPKLLPCPFQAINVAPDPRGVHLPNHDLALWVIATYGDQELLDHVEDFLVTRAPELSGARYSICELGNYYGYDDFEFGAKQITETRLRELGCHEFCPGASVDSLPILDWRAVNAWCRQITANLPHP